MNQVTQDLGVFQLTRRIYKTCTRAEAYVMFWLPEILGGSKTLDEVSDKAIKKVEDFQNNKFKNHFLFKKNIIARFVGRSDVKYALSVSYKGRTIAFVSEPVNL